MPHKMVICLLKNIILFFKWPRLWRIMPRNTLCVNAALERGEGFILPHLSLALPCQAMQLVQVPTNQASL